MIKSKLKNYNKCGTIHGRTTRTPWIRKAKTTLLKVGAAVLVFNFASGPVMAETKCTDHMIGRNGKAWIEKVCSNAKVEYSIKDLTQMLATNRKISNRLDLVQEGKRIIKISNIDAKKYNKTDFIIKYSDDSLIGLAMPRESTIAHGMLRHWNLAKKIANHVGIDPMLFAHILITESNFYESASGDGGLAVSAAQVTEMCAVHVVPKFKLKKDPLYDSTKPWHHATDTQSNPYVIAAYYIAEAQIRHGLYQKTNNRIRLMRHSEMTPSQLLTIYRDYNEGASRRPLEATWQLRNFALKVEYLWVISKVEKLIEALEKQKWMLANSNTLTPSK